MKLFQKLLIAPAALGLFSPISATANEINLGDVSGYASSEEVKSINEFNAKELAVTNSRLDGIEARLNNFEAGSFSDTTALSGSAHIQMGAVENGEFTHAVTTTYSYNLDLNTSFTGEDNLYVGIEAGNGAYGTVNFVTDNSNSNGDTLEVASLFYTFPVGEYEVAVGPKIDNDDLMPTTVSKYSDRFFLAGQPFTGANFTWDLGITGSGVAVARNFDNGWNASASVIGLSANGSDGLLTSEATDTYTASVGYDGDNFGLGLIRVDADEACSFLADYKTCAELGYANIGVSSTTFGGYWTTDNGKTTVSANIGIIEADLHKTTEDNLTQLHLGVDHQIGNGVLSASLKSSDLWLSTGKADNLGELGEIYYTYDVNDSMEITGGFSWAMPDEPQDTANWTWLDQTAIGVEATFKF